MSILDSDIIIDFLRNKEAAVRKIRALKESGEKIHTTVFCYHEVMKGLLKKGYTQKQDLAEMLFSSLGILGYNTNEAKTSAQIEAKLEAVGQKISGFDVPIAAICLTWNAAIITRNLRHFQRIPELKVETW